MFMKPPINPLICNQSKNTGSGLFFESRKFSSRKSKNPGEA
jgi:hypothetical protein